MVAEKLQVVLAELKLHGELCVDLQDTARGPEGQQDEEEGEEGGKPGPARPLSLT